MTQKTFYIPLCQSGSMAALGRAKVPLWQGASVPFLAEKSPKSRVLSRFAPFCERRPNWYIYCS